MILWHCVTTNNAPHFVAVPCIDVQIASSNFLIIKDRDKTWDRQAHVANSHRRATVKKELILFWHARSRRYRIPRRQSQNPASAPQLSHASPEDLDPRNSQWPLLERVPCGHWKGQQQDQEQKKAYACGRSRARITCGTQKSGKTTEGRNARFWQLRPISSGRLIQTGAGCFREEWRTIKRKGWFRISKGYFPSEIEGRVEVPKSFTICRNDNG